MVSVTIIIYIGNKMSQSEEQKSPFFQASDLINHVHGAMKRRENELFQKRIETIRKKIISESNEGHYDTLINFENKFMTDKQTAYIVTELTKCGFQVISTESGRFYINWCNQKAD